MEDREIIKLYLMRSEDAIRQSDKKYGSYCYMVAWRILANQEDAEECVSDTWMRAWRVIPPTIPRILRAFFGKITRNVALNRYDYLSADKRGEGTVALCLDELAECISSGNQTDAAIERRVLTDCLNHFLGSLKETERRIFVQRYWYMQPVKEISRDLSVSESKVKMTLLRTRRKLKEALVEEGIII